MFYDYRLAPYFILLFVGFAATFKGLIVLKTRSMSLPFADGRQLDGPEATRWGYGLVALGILSLVALAGSLLA